MRNKIKFILPSFIILFIPIAFSYSYYDPFYPGSATNPLQVEIVPTPSQIYDQASKAQELRLNQKYQEIYQASILEQQRKLNQDLLESTREQQHKQQLNSILNQSQIIYNSNSIQNAPTKSNDQRCADDYGSSSIWSGKMNDKGGPICDCKDGSQLSLFNTRCYIPEKKVVENTIKKSSGGGGGLVSDTVTPVSKEAIKNSNTPIEKEIITDKKQETLSTNITVDKKEVTPKGFWGRLKWLFGF